MKKYMLLYLLYFLFSFLSTLDRPCFSMPNPFEAKSKAKKSAGDAQRQWLEWEDKQAADAAAPDAPSTEDAAQLQGRGCTVRLIGKFTWFV